MLNYILLRQTGVKYLMLLDASSGYNDLKLNETSSYLTFSCQLAKYQYIRVPFGAASAGIVSKEDRWIAQ